VVVTPVPLTLGKGPPPTPPVASTALPVVVVALIPLLTVTEPPTELLPLTVLSPLTFTEPPRLSGVAMPRGAVVEPSPCSVASCATAFFDVEAADCELVVFWESVAVGFDVCAVAINANAAMNKDTANDRIFIDEALLLFCWYWIGEELVEARISLTRHDEIFSEFAFGRMCIWSQQRSDARRPKE
jgi:hypothetical protein